MNSDNKVLLIDDDVVSSKILASLLQKKGYQTKVLSDATLYEETIIEYGPQVVLLDLIMPDISGQEVLTEIRKKWSKIDLPVIVVTSKVDQEDVIDCLKMGANDYIVKPVNVDIAEARLNTQLSLAELNNKNVKFKEIETLNSMIATYNHEILNPLTIAFSNMQIFNKKNKQEDLAKYLKNSMDAMSRISDIVKKIESLSAGSNEKNDYTDDVKTYKIK